MTRRGAARPVLFQGRDHDLVTRQRPAEAEERVLPLLLGRMKEGAHVQRWGWACRFRRHGEDLLRLKLYRLCRALLGNQAVGGRDKMVNRSSRWPYLRLIFTTELASLNSSPRVVDRRVMTTPCSFLIAVAPAPMPTVASAFAAMKFPFKSLRLFR